MRTLIALGFVVVTTLGCAAQSRQPERAVASAPANVLVTPGLAPPLRSLFFVALATHTGHDVVPVPNRTPFFDSNIGFSIWDPALGDATGMHAVQTYSTTLGPWLLHDVIFPNGRLRVLQQDANNMVAVWRSGDVVRGYVLAPKLIADTVTDAAEWQRITAHAAQACKPLLDVVMQSMLEQPPRSEQAPQPPGDGPLRVLPIRPDEYRYASVIPATPRPSR